MLLFIQTATYYSKVHFQLKIISKNRIIIWRQSLKMQPITTSFMGHIEGKVYATISQDKMKLVTLGEDDVILLWNTSDMTSRRKIQVSNQEQNIFTCIDYSQRDQVFVVGLTNGEVRIMKQYDTSSIKIIYKSIEPIASVNYSANYEHIGIATGQSKGVVYSKALDKHYKPETGHDGKTTHSNFAYSDKVYISIGTDGYANIHYMQLQSTNQLQLISKLRIVHNESLYSVINFKQRPQHLGHLSLGGTSTLQQIFITPQQNQQNENLPQPSSSSSQSQKLQVIYKIKVELHEPEQIQNLFWFNANIIVFCLADKIVLWNYVTKTRFRVVNDQNWSIMLGDYRKFYGITSNGIIYKYQNQKIVNFQNQQAVRYIENEQKQKQNIENNYMPVQAQKMQQQLKYVQPQRPKTKQISKSARLVTKGIQPGIESYYQSYMDNRFLFYNQHGCIIRRENGQESVTELQYHDRFKLRRIKFQTQQHYSYFALSQDVFMCSTLGHVYFYMEGSKINSQSTTGAKEKYLAKWDCQIDEIQGLAIGNVWVAVATRNAIRILDFSGNELHSISFDRIFMAVAAYEDLLALAYSADVPLGSCNIFQIKIYKIQAQCFKLIKKILMPVKAEQDLKWFGFSHQGCLFNQDSSQTIRMYCWDSNSWVNVYQQDSKNHKVFIQHIENYQLYGFRIQQKEGQPGGPIVLPRSLPKRINFQLSHHKLQFLTEQQNKRFQTIHLHRTVLQHQIFRYRMWYKYKYSRNPGNTLYKLSNKIKSQQQLIQTKTQLDIQLVDQVKKLLPALEKRIKVQELSQIYSQLLGACYHLVYFSQTLGKIRRVLAISDDPLEMYNNQPAQIVYQANHTPYRKMSRLEALIDRGWIQNQVVNQ